MVRRAQAIGLAAWVLLGLASGARADGLAFGPGGGEERVRATSQRAALWLRRGVWELHLQPVFPRGSGAAAWVVPFPVRPEVAPGDADFLDQLELVTAPVFLEVCPPVTDSCFGQGLGDDGPGEVLGGTAAPELWERGEVAGLDYVVLSSAGGDDPAAWLRAEGYAVPDAALIPLAVLAREGAFFFVARLDPGADPARPLPPVRFRLPGLENPAYPLRLTAAGVTPGQHLDLTLWLVTPLGQDWLPAERRATTPPTELAGPAALGAVLDEMFLAEPDGLALLHSASPRETGAFDGRICGWRHTCVDFAAVGLERPDAWCPDMELIRADAAWVQRFQARLPPTGLRDDLRFRPRAATEYLDRVERVYLRLTCQASLAVAGPLLLALLALGLGLGRRAGGRA